ncbi:MAG: cytidine deaminase [Bacteroidales bacterium]|jgi:cytidine deaminase|nr:cytidine deaminase [Bacteroidales bacterium]
MENKELKIKYTEYNISEINTEDENLIEKAKEAAQNSYSPYSHFKVGAAVLLENGIIIKGSNQENAAFPSSLCAERVTLFYANATYPDIPAKILAITAFGSNNEILDEIITPCGACRQVILETENRFNNNCRILLASKEKVLEFQTIKDLLPFSFGKEDLK